MSIVKRKFYLTPSKDAPQEFIFDYSWDNVGGAERHGTTWDAPSEGSFAQLSLTESSPTFVLRSGYLTYRTLFYQFVSDPLTQTLDMLAGTGYPFNGPMLRAQRILPAFNIVYPAVYRAAVMKVFKPDGSVRMILGGMPPLSGMLSRTKLQALGFSAGLSGPLYDAEPGDFIVTEIGIQAYIQNVGQNGTYEAELEVGDGALIDLKTGDTEQYNSWSGIHWTAATPSATGGPTARFLRAAAPTRRALHQQHPAVAVTGGFLGDIQS